ncbi:BACON domain-containing protein [Candidatus Chloroploca asiatica]|uniref:BACON domain-containing protein n=1 Tax=Candidatus Chloroploca asiatica TaxID=1506545 RepID=UPI001141FD61|nr:BACON domain-containing protein [Candidatus Chloroploca asiatica]
MKRVILLLVLISILVTTVPSSHAEPDPGLATRQAERLTMFGMNTYFTGLERFWNDGDAGIATLVAEGRQLGVAWGREELSWANLERAGKGEWDWALMDRRILEMAEAGYGIVGMLLTTPQWARIADCEPRRTQYASAGVFAEAYWCPPASTQDFADYVATVVERYDGDGINDAPGSPRIAVWQIWNEPNAWETWPGSPAEYAALLETGYLTAKAADPTAIVATGGLYVFDGGWNDGIGHRDGLSFMNDALAARPSIWFNFDALAIHPYMPTAAPDGAGIFGSVTMWGRLTTSRNWLNEQTARRGGPVRPIWISEVGWSTCTAADPGCLIGGAARNRTASNPEAQHLYFGPTASRAPLHSCRDCNARGDLSALVGKSEDQQANYLVRTYGIALAQGITHLNWFQLEDKFDGAAQNFWQQAALLRTVREGYARKPAANAYATLVAQLGPEPQFVGFGPLHTFQHQADALSSVARFHLRFTTPDRQTVDLIWRNEGLEDVAVPLQPGANASLFNRDGQAVALPIQEGQGIIRLSESPVYLRQALPPVLQHSPAAIAIMVRPGTGPQNISIALRNAGSGTITWQTELDVAWASVQPASGTGYTSDLLLTLDPSALGEGTHTGTLRITSSAGNATIPLRVIVSSQLNRHYLPLVGR